VGNGGVDRNEDIQRGNICKNLRLGDECGVFGAGRVSCVKVGRGVECDFDHVQAVRRAVQCKPCLRVLQPRRVLLLSSDIVLHHHSSSHYGDSLDNFVSQSREALCRAFVELSWFQTLRGLEDRGKQGEEEERHLQPFALCCRVSLYFKVRRLTHRTIPNI
jgi:hypothetical protein